VANGFGADVQRGGDVGVAAPRGEQLEQLAFAAGQSVWVSEDVGAAAALAWSAQRCQSLLGASCRGPGTKAAEGGQRRLHRGDVAAEFGNGHLIGPSPRCVHARTAPRQSPAASNSNGMSGLSTTTGAAPAIAGIMLVLNVFSGAHINLIGVGWALAAAVCAALLLHDVRCCRR
jgi:hypothetical protein